MPSRSPIPANARLTLAVGVVSTALPGETVILDPASDSYVSLEGVGPRVWELIEASTTLDESVTRIADEYDVDRATCERDVRSLLDELVDRGLVLISDEPA